ncbi:MAG: sulfite exporter TauE/SafE family protein [Pseudomonadota bacterium]
MLIWLIAATGFFTAALSGVAGVGGGTILIGVLFALGLAPTSAVPLLATAQLVSNFSRTLAYLRHVEWRALFWFSLTGIPAPFLVAPYVAAMDINLIRLILAGFILVSLVPTPKGEEPIPEIPALLLAGFLNGSVGMFVGATGLFVGRLFLRPEWKKETVIGTLALCQTLGHALKVIAYGSVGFTVFAQTDLLLPLLAAVIAGTGAGRMLNRYLSEDLFRRLFKSLLLALSLKLVFDGLVGFGWIAWN